MRIASPGLQRSVIAAVQVLALSVWFSASAVVPSLRAEWGISEATSVWLTATVQIGFVVGALLSTAANLADRMPAPALMAGSAALAAGCTVAVSLVSDQLGLVFGLRFLTGVFLAGVYPVGMRLMASWSPGRRRGQAMGLMIGALTVGSALPHLIGGLATLPWREVLRVTAILGLLGAALAISLARPGPHVASTTAATNPRYAIAMFSESRPRLANLGYFGHMWELYALWTWLPAFLSAAPVFVDSGDSGGRQILVFVAMGVFGLIGCLIGGWAADRFGRPVAAGAALTVSGSCCLLAPLAFLAPLPVLAAFCAVWGAAVIADSGVFSTALSESADPRFIGTALTAQTAIGFALTVVSIQLVQLLAALTDWQFAFWLLAPGPLLGALAMRRLHLQTTR